MQLKGLVRFFTVLLVPLFYLRSSILYLVVRSQ